jgi:hypothetical protein
MGTGGTIQLVAYGAQDLYLTSKPQITFWKSVHKRHTLFAVEPIKQEINGSVGFGKRFTVSISKNGDMLHGIMLEVQLPDLAQIKANVTALQNFNLSYVNDIGLYLFKSIELDIGGARIERHTSEWLDCWLNLTTPASKRAALNKMIGHVDGSGTFVGGDDTGSNGKTLYIPLQFFFNRHPGLALPLVAMTFHDVKIHFELRSFVDCIRITESNVGQVQVPSYDLYKTILEKAAQQREVSLEPKFDMYADVIFLDTTERQYFSTQPHEYLIEQVQFLGQEKLDNKVDGDFPRRPIPFVNPVKELVWVFTLDARAPLDYADMLKSLRLVMNGNDRFSVRRGSFFKTVQPYKHHTNAPDKPIYVFSFALTPEEFQPSGTCNFSKLESAYMQMELDWSPYVSASAAAALEPALNIREIVNSVSPASSVQAYLHVFAMSYNVMRIIDGLAGLAYHA